MNNRMRMCICAMGLICVAWTQSFAQQLPGAWDVSVDLQQAAQKPLATKWATQRLENALKRNNIDLQATTSGVRALSARASIIHVQVDPTGGLQVAQTASRKALSLSLNATNAWLTANYVRRADLIPQAESVAQAIAAADITLSTAPDGALLGELLFKTATQSEAARIHNSLNGLARMLIEVFHSHPATLAVKRSLMISTQDGITRATFVVPACDQVETLP